MKLVKTKNDVLFLVLLFGMAVYYGYRMFALTPWYDELYTYYCFISRGPVYAAIHWPLPNNHVGYSVLSAVLDVLGNSYIGLRGISYLCAIGNLVLIKKIAEEFLTPEISLVTVILYASFYLVNQQAVQGRGYTLGVTCFLSAIWFLSAIIKKQEVRWQEYLGYTCSLVLALYTLTSDVYFVIPLCLAGGVALLCRKEVRKFWSLVLWSLLAAAMTLLLYAVIWLAIGSNLLVKDSAGSYFGMSHGAMILANPFAALGRGMEYMLASPYIQSEDRAGFAGRLASFFVTLLEYIIREPQYLALVLMLIGIGVLIWRIIYSWKQNRQGNTFLELLLLFQIVFLPICLLIQCKRPYYRVFTYLGVVLALTIGILIQTITGRGNFKKAEKVFLALCGIYLVYCLAFGGYNDPYGSQETLAADAWEHVTISENEKICVTDCNQEYLLYFLKGIRCENHEIADADVVMLDKRMLKPDFSEMVWEWYVYYPDIPWQYVEQHMKPVYENDGYIVYTKKEKGD